jgi:hypothetical protein
MFDKIIETAASHPLYMALGVATLLYLAWAIFKRVLKIMLLAGLLVLGYLSWMYFHP